MSVHEFYRLKALITLEQVNTTNKTNAPLHTSSVVNTSNVTLTDNETQLLARGLGFCPSPRHIDWTEVTAEFDEFARRLRITEFFLTPSTPKAFGHHPPTETTRLMLTSSMLNLTY